MLEALGKISEIVFLSIQIYMDSARSSNPNTKQGYPKAELSNGYVGVNGHVSVVCTPVINKINPITAKFKDVPTAYIFLLVSIFLKKLQMEKNPAPAVTAIKELYKCIFPQSIIRCSIVLFLVVII